MVLSWPSCEVSTQGVRQVPSPFAPLVLGAVSGFVVGVGGCLGRRGEVCSTPGPCTPHASSKLTTHPRGDEEVTSRHRRTSRGGQLPRGGHCPGQSPRGCVSLGAVTESHGLGGGMDGCLFLVGLEVQGRGAGG